MADMLSHSLGKSKADSGNTSQGETEKWVIDQLWLSASLAEFPNRFLAIVPLESAEEYAIRAKEAIQCRVDELKLGLADWFYRLIDNSNDDKLRGVQKQQIDAQLSNWPFISYSVSPWELNVQGTGGGGTHFSDSYHHSEELIQMAKSVRPFSQVIAKSPRDSLTGEREAIRTVVHGDEAVDTAAVIAKEREGWQSLVKKHDKVFKSKEMLDASGLLKRWWGKEGFSAAFFEKLGQETEKISKPIPVASTQILGIAPSLHATLDDALKSNQSKKPSETASAPGPCAWVPPRLWKRIKNHENRDWFLANLCELEEASTQISVENSDATKFPLYFATVVADGDHLGQFLHGDLKDREGGTIPESRFLAQRVSKHFSDQDSLSEGGRKTTSARLSAISEALGTFSRLVVPHVLRQFDASLIYAGGDDVFYLSSVPDVLDSLAVLRTLYRGDDYPKDGAIKGLSAGGGFLVRDQGGDKSVRLTMGCTATLSAGIAIVHAQSPLRRAVDLAREAERSAKSEGRNRVGIYVQRRSSPLQRLVLPFDDFRPHSGTNCSDVLESFDALSKFLGKYRVNSYYVIDTLRRLADENLDPEQLIKVTVGLFREIAKRRDGVTAESIDKAGNALEMILNSGVLGSNLAVPAVIDRIASLLDIAEFLGRWEVA
jgi:hypothetical protein